MAASKFKRELKKLENSITYGDSLSEKGRREKKRWDVVSGANGG